MYQHDIWYMSLYIDDRLACSFGCDVVSMRCLTQTCTPDSHVYRVTCTICRIDTINSPDNGHMAARNMQIIEKTYIKKELCVKLVIYKDYTEMHGQQNIKFPNSM